MKVTVLYNQSLLDVSIQEYGTIEAVFELALANGLGITEEMIAGTVLNIPTAVKNKDVADYYYENGISPATGGREIHNIPVIGIGEMIIGTSFIIG